jgi:putative Mn2+ efflux pump MntP
VTFGAIVLLSLGLAMDATAVAAARGLAAPRIRLGDWSSSGSCSAGFKG